jgi:hypothetical protein
VGIFLQGSFEIALCSNGLHQYKQVVRVDASGYEFLEFFVFWPGAVSVTLVPAGCSCEHILY